MTNRIAVNRDTAMATIMEQIKDLDDIQLSMVADYIKGLKAAEKFLGQGWR